MTTLERIELVLRRMHADRQEEFRNGTRPMLDEGVQEFIKELADGLAEANKPSFE